MNSHKSLEELNKALIAGGYVPIPIGAPLSFPDTIKRLVKELKARGCISGIPTDPRDPRFPHVCPYCSGPAYVGAVDVDCKI
jgi:hypothetical protein